MTVQLRAPRLSAEALLFDASQWMLTAAQALSDDELRIQADPAFSPIGWHLGHVAWQEELWLQRRALGLPALDRALDTVFDAFQPNKSERGQLIPSRAELFHYRELVRQRTLSVLPRLLDEPPDLMQGVGLIHFMANHELQHAESVYAARRLLGVPLSTAALPPRVEVTSERFVAVKAGDVVLGEASDLDGWDNERPVWHRTLPAFELAREPVSNAAWLEFMHAGGYRDARYWTDAGIAFIQRAAVEAPMGWVLEGGEPTLEVTLHGAKPWDPAGVVVHVSFYEAQAYARFRQARLPREAEWEFAARRAAAGELPLRLLQDSVWQWTAEAFAPYPGFVPQRYKGYSAPWFDGKHYVLRGGAYVTAPRMRRVAFRNWFLPELRQPFLGVRLARSEAP